MARSLPCRASRPCRNAPGSGAGYAAANIVALIPLTPGGLGIVEADLASLLVLAGVPSGPAFVATLAYRLVSYWLPVLIGGPAYLMFRHRYGAAWWRSSAHQTDK